MENGEWLWKSLRISFTIAIFKNLTNTSKSETNADNQKE